MNKAMGFVTFVLGAAVGSAATWYLVKKKYEQLAQEEIDSVKEQFTYKKNSEDTSTSEKDLNDIQETAKRATEKPSIADYTKELSKTGYTNYATISDADDEDDSIEARANKKPYLVSPEEFGEREEDGYHVISWTYYADHILADENDELVEDIEGSIGFESLNHFGDYEDDALFVRNDRLKADFEVLISAKTYEEVLQQKPYLRRGD